jgi:amino acid adenylation domain-containing protein
VCSRPAHLPAASTGGPGGIAARVLRWAAAQPAQAALEFGPVAVTYAGLCDQALATACSIRGAFEPGVDDGAQPVSLLFGHGPAMVAAIIGALIAGKAYVPLDPSYPVARLRVMHADAGAPVIASDAAHAHLAREIGGDAKLTEIRGAGPAVPLPGAGSPVRGDQPAYILYTSGTTGRPKGVVHTHDNVLFQVDQHTASLGIGPDDKLSVVSSFSFDSAVTDLFSALCNGATAVLADARAVGPEELATRLAGHGVTIYHSTPSVYRSLMRSTRPAAAFSAVRAIVLGGEQLTRRDVEDFARCCPDGCVLVNGYGLTEVSFAVQERLTGIETVHGDVVPIGRPLPGVDVVLVDDHGRESASYGEMLISSRHLARGYWRRPDATAAAFGAPPGEPGVRTFRTGDMAHRLPDGRLVFAGRRDRQVKIRGNRVELSEVEARLTAHPGVTGAVAVGSDEDGTGTQALIAYVTSRSPASVDTTELRRALSGDLPSFMVPSRIVIVDSFPLTATNKVDVRALTLMAHSPPGAAATAALGNGGTEGLVASIWRDVLNVAAVGPDESFFDLGGHSLLMARVQTRLAETLGRPMPMTELFAHPTVATLARFLDAGAGRGDGSAGLQDGSAELDRVERVRRRGLRRRQLHAAHALEGDQDG